MDKKTVNLPAHWHGLLKVTAGANNLTIEEVVLSVVQRWLRDHADPVNYDYVAAYEKRGGSR